MPPAPRPTSKESPWNLSRVEHDKLSLLQRTNRPIYRAYRLKEALAACLDRRQPHVANQKLRESLGWAR